MGSCEVSSRVRGGLKMSYTCYTELGFQISNIRFAVRIPNMRIRRPRFWRKKMSVNSREETTPTLSGSSKTSSTPSLSSPSTEDWIAQFHALYNPIHTTTPTSMPYIPSPCLTSTPVKLGTNHLVRERSRVTLHDMSGVKIYEDLEDVEVEDTPENISDDCYQIVAVDNNKVIGKATFGTLKTRKTVSSRRKL